MDERRKTFSEEISDFLNPAPAAESEDEDFNKVISFQSIHEGADSDGDRGQISALRQRNVPLLKDYDGKYNGKKISRRSLDAEWGNLNAEEFSSLQSEEISNAVASGSSEDEENGMDCEVSSDASKDCGLKSDRDTEDLGPGGVSTSSRDDLPCGVIFCKIEEDAEAELEKSRATKCQLNLWGSLLDARVHMQKCLQDANQLPQHDTYQLFEAAGSSEFRYQASSVTTVLQALLNMLLDLQKLLKPDTDLKGAEETEQRDSRECDTEESVERISIYSQCSEPQNKKTKFDYYSGLIAKRHKSFTPYRDSVIQKWSCKTRIASGRASGTLDQFGHSVLQQIENCLSDRNRLIRRTQLNRLMHPVLGTKTETPGNQDEPFQDFKEFDDEIFDDSDFYQQLLREFIDNYSNDTADHVTLRRKWLMLQKTRSSMKGGICVRATKGRRVRYSVHSKLVNFMAPVNNSIYTEEASQELYKSLFGK